MQNVTRSTLTLLLAVTLCGATWAKTAPKESEYKRSDTNYYWKGDVLKVDPDAVILPMSGVSQKGDSYFFTPKKKAPKEIYVSVVNDWIEPITPPNMPASLGVASDAMQIREPQGDVQVAFPTAPATFLPVTEGMAIPNGTVVKTGANGTAAVLFGGVDSARLIPNSEAAVQQTVTSTSRSTEVDLTTGAVFSKVGQRIGETEDYKVHTPFGIAAARGTDFVSVAMPARTDVWIAQGTVQLDAPDGKTVGTVKSEGTGALKIIRFPVMSDMKQAMMASSETMTAAMNFIPIANVKIKALHDKIAQGVKLTATEQDYMGRIKKVPCLIKLALVEPPAPVPAPPVPAPILPAPTVAPVPAPTPAAPAAPTTTPATPTTTVAPAPEAPLPPVEIEVLKDGKAKLVGVTLSLHDLRHQLADLSKKKPGQSAIVQAGKDVPEANVKKVVSICKKASFKDVKTTVLDTPSEPAAPAPAATPAPPPMPAPEPPPAKPLPPVMQLPLNLQLRPDGKVDFKDATITLNDLKVKLEEIAIVTPDQPLVVTGREKVTRAQLKKVLAVCKEANLQKVTVAKAEPVTGLVASTGSPPAPAATSTPDTPSGPTSASMAESTSGNAPPVAPIPPAQVSSSHHHHTSKPETVSAATTAASPNVPIETGPHDTIP